MRILIVDDERLVRVTLESMLKELGETGIIRHARNGEELAEALRQSSFDLIFLDINMPRQQGLEVMEAVKHENPETDWCILTGYNYFEYAKKALELGAKGYLLKPPDPEELKKFLFQIRMEREERQKRKRSFFVEAIQKAIYLNDIEGISTEGKEEYMLYTFFVDMHSEEKRRIVNCQLYERLETFMEHYRDETREEFVLFFGTTGELCMLLKGKGGMRINAFLRGNMADYTQEAAISGISSQVKKIEDLKEMLKFQIALAPLRFYSRNMEIVSAEEFDRDPLIMKKQYFAVQLEKALAEYMAGDMESLHQEVKKMEEDGTEYYSHGIFTKEVKRHLEIILEYHIQAENVPELLRELWRELSRRELGVETKQELIWKICHYVRQNYMEDVSIDRMGEVFQITPTYLSRFFREKTGKKYIDYVTGIRMEKAKELLSTHKYSVKEISKMVGYSSEKHFSRYFKKYYDRNPSQID